MEAVLLLHGALGSKRQFDKLIPKLRDKFEVYCMDFEGHGSAGPVSSPFRIEYFVENVLGFLDEYKLQQINIFGYSMGGYVALALAKEYPERVKRIATLGTIFQWDQNIARRECRYLDPDKMEAKVPQFVAVLDERHLFGWKTVVNQTREMLRHLGHAPTLTGNDWQEIESPVRMYVGDSDTTAGLEPTVEIYNKLSASQLCVLPDTPHPFEKVKIDYLAISLSDFFGGN